MFLRMSFLPNGNVPFCNLLQNSSIRNPRKPGLLQHPHCPLHKHVPPRYRHSFSSLRPRIQDNFPFFNQQQSASIIYQAQQQLSQETNFSSALNKIYNSNNREIRHNSERFKRHVEELCCHPTQSQQKRSNVYKPNDDISFITERSSIKRKWINLYDYKSKIRVCKNNADAFDFIIGSYNVLSQNLLEDHINLYQHCSDELLSWEYRSNNIITELYLGNADIYCLQEVNQQHYDNFFQQKMKVKGYASVFKKRTNDKEDGCATFWKKSKFNLIKHSLIEYKVDGERNLNRDNIGVVVLLEPVGMKKKGSLCIGNTHLLYNPKRGDVKLAQLMMLLAEMDSLVIEEKNCSVLLCGDLNSVPFSNIYKFVDGAVLHLDNVDSANLSGQKIFKSGNPVGRSFVKKDLKISSDCKYVRDDSSAIYSIDSGTIKNQLKLKSAYRHFKTIPGQAKLAESTTCHGDTNQTVDYIFYNVAEKTRLANGYVNAFEGKLKLLSCFQLPTMDEMNVIGPLPNKHFSSDHVLLMAKFLMIT